MRNFAIFRNAFIPLAGLLLVGCSGSGNPKAGVPPTPQVEVGDLSLFHADHPEQFQLTAGMKIGSQTRGLP
ncbi:MAG TPA: hypothetical protein VEJ46_13685 [Candidatus Acidoferrum sp.]|nr:hypothetical protein [Candidatus Acidoferrum sp.]